MLTNLKGKFKTFGTLVIAVIDWIGQAGAYLACVGYIVMALAITSEALVRNIINISTLVADEVTSYLLAFAVFIALAYTWQTGGHLRITLIYERLNEKIQWVLELIIVIIGIISITFLTIWITKNLVIYSYMNKVTSQSVLMLPLWIPQTTLVIGLSLLILALIVSLSRLITHKNFGKTGGSDMPELSQEI